MNPTYINVLTDHTDDSLFGQEGPPDTEYNPDQLLDNLYSALVKEFPAIEIRVISSNRTSIDTDGGPDTEDVVLELIHETWENWLDELA